MTRRAFLSQAAALTGLATLGGCAPAHPEITGGFVGVAMDRGHHLRDAVRGAARDGVQGGPGRQAQAAGPLRRTRVLIAGGGVAGLAAARALRLRGVDDFALLELEDSAGGNSRAGQLGGLACPLGAHYLPLPGDAAPEVQDLLSELGLAQRGAAGWRLNAAGERQLCHSPQERLFFHGQWQEGLLPLDGVGASTLAQYQRMADAVAQAQARARFVLPVARHGMARAHHALDAISLQAWLTQQGLDDAHLRWYLDYCCRDDYGAGLGSVSAWAGVHYFASRHGFHAPGREAAGEDAGVLTWPEGNGWLTQRLAAPLASRLHCGRTVTRIEVLRQGVQVDALDQASGQTERWLADSCIVALPLFIAARLLVNPPAALREAASAARYAPWLVANLHLRAPLQDRPGAAPAWDNVVYTGGTPGPLPGAPGALAATQPLGYVNATHQSLSPLPGPTVLTHYRAFGLDPDQRRRLRDLPWQHWRDQLLADLAAPHPDLAALTTRIDVMRYGHAMAVPVPGFASHPALQALQATGGAGSASPRLQFAHSDLSGYSVFEEAFAQGHRAGLRA